MAPVVLGSGSCSAFYAGSAPPSTGPFLERTHYTAPKSFAAFLTSRCATQQSAP
jgi:hypothetical protein